ncbi:MAG: cell division protein FtsQ/DivIB [Pseudomonadota bacterium]|nr:cell division protein FtsQ/DivIB [Pseudomonadota bacterium]
MTRNRRTPITSTTQKDSLRERVRAVGSLRAGGVVAAVLALAGAGYALAQVPLTEWRPIRRVEIEGPFVAVGLAEIEEVIRPYVSAGFFGTPLATIADAVESLPWVDQVNVRRRWPDVIRIEIWEHAPVARWGELALLNRRGERFAEAIDSIDLPLLNGPEGSEKKVLMTYQDCRNLLAERQLQLVELAVDHRGSWRATLAQGVELRMGQGRPQATLSHFLKLGLPAVRDRLNQLAYIDLRYPNGFAVRSAMPTTDN